MTVLLAQSFEIFGIRFGATQVAQRAIAAVAILVGGLIVYQVGKVVIGRIARPKYPFTPQVAGRSDTARSLLLSIWRYLIALVVLVGLLALLPATVGQALALTGVAGVIVALAANAILRDVVAGFSILLEGQYAVGDRVRLLGVDVEGTVEGIGLRLSVLREDDGGRVFVPNGAITAVRVIEGAAAPAPDGPRRRSTRGGRSRTAQRGGRRRPAEAEATTGSAQKPAAEAEPAAEAPRQPERTRPERARPERARPERARPERAAPAASVFEVRGSESAEGGEGAAPAAEAAEEGGEKPDRPDRARRGGRRRGGKRTSRSTGARRTGAAAKPEGDEKDGGEKPEPETRPQRRKPSSRKPPEGPGDDVIGESPWSIE